MPRPQRINITMGLPGPPGPRGLDGSGVPVVTYYIDPLNGSDSNPGTALSPMRSFPTGAYPALARWTRAIVQYVGSTPDPIPAGTYTLPHGCGLELLSPWADVGLGTRTVFTGTTALAIVDQAAQTTPLTLNAWAGARIRVLTGTRAGELHSCIANSTTAFGVGSFGTGTALSVGDTFVVERPVGGWSLPSSATVYLDATARATSISSTGFKLLSSTSGLAIYGLGTPVSLAGLYADGGATTLFLSLSDCHTRWGRTGGSLGGLNVGKVGARGTGCSFRSSSGAGSFVAINGGSSAAFDTVMAGMAWSPSNGAVDSQTLLTLDGLVASGQRASYQAFGATVSVNQAIVRNCGTTAFQLGVSSTQPGVGVRGSVFGVVADSTVTQTPLYINGGEVSLLGCTGTIGTNVSALRITQGARILQSSNTIQGTSSSNAVLLGGLAAQAWPASGSGLITDLTTATVAAGTAQNCSLFTP